MSTNGATPTGTDATEAGQVSTSDTSKESAGSTRPDVQAQRNTKREATAADKRRAHARATELEARARNLSGMIAGLDEERTKCLIEAAVLRLAHR